MEGKHVAIYGKHLKTGAVPRRSRRSGVKALALVLTLVLTVGGAIGGTIAWLTAAPDPVVNTFTYGDINITLTETDTGLDGDGSSNTNLYKMFPGQTIDKDPLITVKAGSESMYLFVKLEGSANFADFMSYDMASGWTALGGVDGVYHQVISAEAIKASDMPVPVIANNTVYVRTDVTKDMLNALDDPANPNAPGYPTLTVTAYAMQHAGNASPEEAWSRIINTAAP